MGSANFPVGGFELNQNWQILKPDGSRILGYETNICVSNIPTFLINASYTRIKRQLAARNRNAIKQILVYIFRF